jgi:hypothetical protein
MAAIRPHTLLADLKCSLVGVGGNDGGVAASQGCFDGTFAHYSCIMAEARPSTVQIVLVLHKEEGVVGHIAWCVRALLVYELDNCRWGHILWYRHNNDPVPMCQWGLVCRYKELPV